MAQPFGNAATSANGRFSAPYGSDIGWRSRSGIGSFVPLCKVSFLCIGDVVGP